MRNRQQFPHLAGSRQAQYASPSAVRGNLTPRGFSWTMRTPFRQTTPLFFGFCELVSLMLALPAGDALYKGDPISVRMAIFAVLGLLSAIAGPMWPRFKGKLPRRFSVTFVRAAADFRWWLVVLLFGLIVPSSIELLFNPRPKPGQIIGYVNDIDTGEVVAGSGLSASPAALHAIPAVGTPTHALGHLTEGEKWQLGEKMRDFNEYILIVIYYSDRAKVAEEIVDVAKAGEIHVSSELSGAELPDGITVCGRASNPHVQQLADVLSNAYNEKVGLGDCGKGPADDSLTIRLGAPS
jgi:hypothetical protein